jgi:integrase
MKEATMLTIKAVETLKQGQTVWDTGRGSVAGFGVRRQLKRPSYFLKYRVNGRQRWLTIGLHGAPWTPDMARDEAHRLLGDVAKGLDPAAVKGAIRKAPIVAELIDQYLAAARSGKLLTGRGRAKKPSTLVTDAYRLAAHVIPNLGHIKVNAVSRHDIEKLRDRLMDAGSGAARTLGLVGAVFQFAVKKGLRTDNPVRGIDRPADGKRTRRLLDDEFNALGSALKSDMLGIWPLAMAATKFLALSGWRLGEAANLQWREIDLATRTALLSDTKTGASARALSYAAIDTIKNLPRFGEFVFSSADGKNLTSLSTTVKRILHTAGLPGDISAHTLRHSFASVAADLGMSEITIAALLGHSKASVTSRYTHHADAVILQAADRVADEIVRRMGGAKAGAAIVELRGQA